ncbi:MAG: phosphate-starvation-inducible PsiE family protein [Calditrichaeota bacterium]|nr:phosphate-starvation-inducible PsiE family protein [Calditrichota bacterium]
MTRVIAVFERWVTIAVVVMMMVAIAAATVELAVILVRELIKPPLLLLDIKEMLEVFGFFLMILIGLELLATVRAYLRQARLCVEVVFLVAMIALARKVIILDYKEVPPLVLVGIAAILVALSWGYTMLRRVHARRLPESEETAGPCGPPPVEDKDSCR